MPLNRARPVSRRRCATRSKGSYAAGARNRFSAQSPEKPGAKCGALVCRERRELRTTVACCDGLGSDLSANLTAELFVSRLLQLERCGVFR